MACSLSYAYFTDIPAKGFHTWVCEDVCDALSVNIFVKFGNIIYRQIVWISMGTNCAPLIAYLFKSPSVDIRITRRTDVWLLPATRVMSK